MSTTRTRRTAATTGTAATRNGAAGTEARAVRRKRQPAGETRSVPIDAIERHPDNPRFVFDDDKIRLLADSLQSGAQLLQRIVLRPLTSDGSRFQLLAGERRQRAAEVAGWKEIPAEIRHVDDTTALEIMVAENFQREQLNPIEQARAIRLLTDPVAQGGAGQKKHHVAKRLGKSGAWASNLLRLLRLPREWQQRVIEGLHPTKARMLVPYAKRPEVLAAIARDLETRPDKWQTRQDFEIHTERIALTFEDLADASSRSASNGNGGQPAQRVAKTRRATAAEPAKPATKLLTPTQQQARVLKVTAMLQQAQEYINEAATTLSGVNRFATEWDRLIEAGQALKEAVDRIDTRRESLWKRHE